MGSSRSRWQRSQLHVELEPRMVLSGSQPSATEQLFLELLNDARANPAAYGASIGVNLSYIAPSPPLAWDPRLIQAAQGQSQAMNAEGFFAHTNPYTGLDPGGRIAAAGYSYTTWGESIAGGSVMPTPAAALAALIIDAGVPSLGHRDQLLDYGSAYTLQTQVGIGIVQNGSGPLTNYYTIDTAGDANTNPFITGVAFNDVGNTGQYAAGEGFGGATITVAGIGSTTTFASGGYSIQVAPGVYTVVASGGGLPAPITTLVQVGASNVRLNFTPQAGSSGTAIPPTELTNFVGLLYQDVLGRSGSASDIAAWVQALQAGVSRQAVVAAFLASPEYDGNQVSAVYQQFLHRNPDPAGLTAWVSAMQAGVTKLQVEQLVLSSSEFFDDHGGTATGFVDALYSNALDRTPTTSEASIWTALAASGDRAEVIAGIMNSREADADAIAGMYTTYLRRTVDSAGLNAMVEYAQATQDRYLGLDILLASAEYFNGAQSWYTG